MFIINCKNYDEIAGDKIIKIAKTAEKVSRKYKVPIAIAPPHHLIPLITKFKIIFQHFSVTVKCPIFLFFLISFFK